MKAKIELTDLFGGEANYSWIRGGELEVRENEPRSSIIRRAKSELGISGSGTTSDFGTMLEHKMHGTVMFILFKY